MSLGFDEQKVYEGFSDRAVAERYKAACLASREVRTIAPKTGTELALYYDVVKKLTIKTAKSAHTVAGEINKPARVASQKLAILEKQKRIQRVRLGRVFYYYGN
jgi:hypothetical protein